MTREAALLGVPTFSVFSGRRPAVDRLLESEGRLQHVTTPSQIPLDGRRLAPVSANRIRARAAAIEATFAGAVFELLTRKGGFG
jgi:predicted glycosyltransferase